MQKLLQIALLVVPEQAKTDAKVIADSIKSSAGIALEVSGGEEPFEP